MGNFCSKAPRTENGDLDHGQKAEKGSPSQDFQSNAAVSTDHVQNAVEPSLPPSLAINFSFSRNTFVREELERATNGFSDANFLGKGGFGTVHKGVLGDGRRVAIKQLIVGSRQGDHEFQSEVEIISRVHHRHLVTLVGWCIADGERMLVYEFVPNNTLKFHLHENKELTMDWPTRMKIALGSAKGLAYLHEDCNPKIIHRDIKSDNILLNYNYDAKIADFGLARIFPDDQTHVDVSKIAGTFGYVDPQYASTGELTDKSDVYSFGVILLELVTGFQSLFKTIGRSRNSLVAWAWPLLEDHNFDGLVDTRLQKNYNAEELTRILECAAACVRVSSRSRPRMSEVLRVLEGHSPVGILREEDVYSRNASYKPNGRSPLQMPAVPEHDTNNSTSSVAFFSTNSNQEQSRGNEPSSRQGLQASSVIGMKMVTV